MPWLWQCPVMIMLWSYHVTFMLLLCHCYIIAMLRSWHGHDVVMSLSWHGHFMLMSLLCQSCASVLTWLGNDHAISHNHKRVLAVFYNWPCCGLVMVIALLWRGHFVSIAWSCHITTMVMELPCPSHVTAIPCRGHNIILSGPCVVLVVVILCSCKFYFTVI